MHESAFQIHDMAKAFIADMPTARIVKEKSMWDGLQIVVAFPNNYGASIVRHGGSYGSDDDLFELAVIAVADAESNDILRIDDQKAWHITYETSITNDVLGYLTEAQVLETLKEIASLNVELRPIPDTPAIESGEFEEDSIEPDSGGED